MVWQARIKAAMKLMDETNFVQDFIKVGHAMTWCGVGRWPQGAVFSARVHHLVIFLLVEFPGVVFNRPH